MGVRQESITKIEGVGWQDIAYGCAQACVVCFSGGISFSQLNRFDTDQIASAFTIDETSLKLCSGMYSLELINAACWAKSSATPGNVWERIWCY